MSASSAESNAGSGSINESNGVSPLLILGGVLAALLIGLLIWRAK